MGVAGQSHGSQTKTVSCRVIKPSRQFGCAGRNFVSTVGVAAYLGECYSFAGLDQIGNLDNDALRGLTADPGLDL